MRHAVIPFVLPLCAAAAAAQEAADPALAAVMAAPPEIQEETTQATGFCRDAGVTPRLTEAYLRSADLNADGALDYVIDMVGLECPGTTLPLCGPEGCLVTVWLSGPEGHARVWGGYAEAVRVEAGGVVVTHAGATCTPAGAACEERLALGEAVPAAEEPVSPEQPTPAEATIAPAPRAAATRDPQPVGAWTLRDVPGGDPIAVSDGPGSLEQVAAFCLGGAPWLSLTLEPQPEAESATIGFAFADASVEATARREEGAGGAYVIELSEGPLAGLLAGRDSRVAVTVDDTPEGVLSLAGSTRAIAGALAPCEGV